MELRGLFERHAATRTIATNAVPCRRHAGDPGRARQRRLGVAALFRTAGRQLAVCEEHAAIVGALAARGEATALAAICAYLERTMQVLKA
jgi:DNA-binding GntR family transcriptional regulator